MIEPAHTYVCLLRGINVSGRKVIRMADLRKLFESIGFGRVETYLQSGNVVFESESAGASSLADRVKDEIERWFGFDVPVIVRERRRFLRVREHNPLIGLEGIDEAKLHVLPVPIAGRDEPRAAPVLRRRAGTVRRTWRLRVPLLPERLWPYHVVQQLPRTEVGDGCDHTQLEDGQRTPQDSVRSLRPAGAPPGGVHRRPQQETGEKCGLSPFQRAWSLSLGETGVASTGPLPGALPAGAPCHNVGTRRITPPGDGAPNIVKDGTPHGALSTASRSSRLPDTRSAHCPSARCWTACP